MRSFSDLDLGAIPRQHPDRNLQPPPGSVTDTDRSISSLRSAKDLQGCTMKRVKGVENVDILNIGAQGIVGVGACIPTFIASCQVAASVPTARNGLVAGRKRSFSL